MGKNRPKGGLLGGFDQLRAPYAPTISVTAGNAQVSVAFTNPSDVGGGAISSYTATAIASGVSTGATSSSSPVTITGLTNGTSYSVTGLANNAFGQSPYSEATTGSPAAPRAFWFGRTTVNIFYSTITSLGNTTDWGYAMRANHANYNCGTTSSATRAVQCGYEFDADHVSGVSRHIEQLDLVSAGAGTNFGDLNVTGAQQNVGLGNGTRGIFTQGYNDAGNSTNVIEYVTIASAGDGTDFGDLTVARNFNSACASPTRGVIIGGDVTGGGSPTANIMDYITIGSTGNATDFGDILSQSYGTASCSSSTRGITAGGSAETGDGKSNVIQYITIASAGNSTDFGDLTNTLLRGGAGCSETRALIAGEYSGNTNGIDYITIASTGNGTDFGDLTNNETNGVSCASNAHGGLQ